MMRANTFVFKGRFSAMLVAVGIILLSGCTNTRFGDPVVADKNGNLPPREFVSVSDKDAAQYYEDATLEKELAASEIVVEKWEKLRLELSGADPKNEKIRGRIGRLIGIAREDKTEIRAPLVKLWAIQYSRLEGADGEKAEKVLLDEVLNQTDFLALVFYQYLAALVAPPDDLSAEDTEKLRIMDHFFKTGERLTPHPKETP